MQRRSDLRDFAGTLPLDAAFPERRSAPSERSMLSGGMTVPRLFASNLPPPERRIALRPLEEMASVPVPEAAIHENCGAMFRKDNVRLPWQVR